MSGYLRQSTASQSRALGPFVDDVDFKTAETGLTIANTDIKLVVNGGASANKNSGGGTHRVNGVYGVTFDATDTATVGELEVSVSVSGALLVFDKFTVVEEATYDALFAASADPKADVNVATIDAGAITATAIAADAFTAAKFAADVTTELQSGLATAAALATVSTNVDSILVDTAEIGTAGAGLTNINLPDQTMNITGNVTGNLSGSVGSVTGAVGSVGTGGITAASLATDAGAEIADAVWDEALSGHAVAGSTGAALSAAGSAGDPWITALPGAYASGTAGYIIGHMTGSIAGAGAITWIYTLTSSSTGLPIADANVWVSSDAAGNNILASGQTDQSGNVTFFLDAGQIYVWRQRSGWNFTNPDSEIVS